MSQASRNEYARAGGFNAKYFRSVLPVFINPGFRNPALKDAQGFGLSHYAANSHVMAANTAMKFSDITDGTSTTILIGEVNARFQPWGHPVNWRDPGRGISRSASGFGDPTGLGYTLFTMADGSVKFVSDRVSPQVLRALATPRGGEEINEEDLDR